MNAKESALELRNHFRHFASVSKNADEEPVNNYLVSKQVAKRSALLCVEIILESCIKDIAHLHYWVGVKSELQRL